MQSGNQKETVLASMSAVREYRENADECFTWARTARSDREREIFLEMARAWLDARYSRQPPNESDQVDYTSCPGFKIIENSQAKTSSRLPAGGARRRYSRRPRNRNAKHQARGHTMARSVFLALQ